MSNASALAERMRKHISDRGGLSKDEDGNPVIPNGAWAMMLEAADVIERQERALLFAEFTVAGPLICAREGAETGDGRIRLHDVKIRRSNWIKIHFPNQWGEQ